MSVYPEGSEKASNRTFTPDRIELGETTTQIIEQCFIFKADFEYKSKGSVWESARLARGRTSESDPTQELVLPPGMPHFSASNLPPGRYGWKRSQH
jgi:hypothetical protein